MKKKISLICPCYNEAENLLIFYNKIKSIFSDNIKLYDYEIVFVDDGSQDDSVSILEKIASEDSNCKVLFNSRNYGVHRSTFNAIKYVTGDMLIPMLPVDMQDDPELIPIFVQKIEEGYDIAYGVKKEREENFFMRSIRNFYYKLVTKISNINIPPYVGEYQLLKKHIYKELLNFDDYYPYIRGIICTLSSNSVGVNYIWKKRIKGKSKTNFFKLLDMGINGVISFSNFPIRIFTILGILISLISFAFIIVQFVSHFYIYGRMSTPGVSTLIVSIFLFSGIQFIFLGVIGEYISAIHGQVRKPKNVVTLKRSLNLENIDKVIT